MNRVLRSNNCFQAQKACAIIGDSCSELKYQPTWYKLSVPFILLCVASDGLRPDTMEILSRRRGKGRGSEGAAAEGGEATTSITLTLNFKRFIFDPKKQMYQ